MTGNINVSAPYYEFEVEYFTPTWPNLPSGPYEFGASCWVNASTHYGSNNSNNMTWTDINVPCPSWDWD
jgi:hypothetical protein